MAKPGDLKSVPAPALNLPPTTTSNTCELWAVDTTADIVCPSGSLLEPSIKGHEYLNLPTFAFYINNTALNKRILFDNGARKDWWNAPPSMAQSISRTAGVHVADDVYDILARGCVDPSSISAIVWSHWHWDHVGNIQRFPKSTDLVVGPGFHDEFIPGYPTRQDAFFYDVDFEGRNVHELAFPANSLRIGRFLAHDYFGDDSFYILFTPGHTASHLAGLVRTTKDTFVFLGADMAHFPGLYRPTPYSPMPERLPTATKLDPRFHHPCPCSMFTVCHRDPENARTSAFYRVSSLKESWFEDADMAQSGVDGLQEFDASENVFIAIAHDPALKEVVEMFPKSSMNEWRAKGWDKQSHWHFVNELPVGGKPGRPLLVEGIYKEGKLSTKIIDGIEKNLCTPRKLSN
jgi:glyoxylase-like metal-dependent hydrolase (beta-lactamase superfamily II)